MPQGQRLPWGQKLARVGRNPGLVYTQLARSLGLRAGPGQLSPLVFAAPGQGAPPFCETSQGPGRPDPQRRSTAESPGRTALSSPLLVQGPGLGKWSPGQVGLVSLWMHVLVLSHQGSSGLTSHRTVHLLLGAWPPLVPLAAQWVTRHSISAPAPESSDSRSWCPLQPCWVKLALSQAGLKMWVL